MMRSLRSRLLPRPLLFFFFFNDTATTEIYTLSLHDALPISTRPPGPGGLPRRFRAAGPGPQPLAVVRGGRLPLRPRWRRVVLQAPRPVGPGGQTRPGQLGSAGAGRARHPPGRVPPAVFFLVGPESHQDVLPQPRRPLAAAGPAPSPPVPPPPRPPRPRP